MNANFKRNSFSTLVAALFCMAPLSANAHRFPVGPPDATIPFPAGYACVFPLTLEQWDNKTQTRDFTDRQGNKHSVSSGKGHDFRMTNTANGKSTTQKAQNFEQDIVTYSNGSQWYSTNGAILIIMFPTDVPAGPSTTYYYGETELYIAVDGVGTLKPPRTYARDICAELS
jgi:hypothetical protein